MTFSKKDLVVEVRFEIGKDANGYPKSRDAEALLCKPLKRDCSLCVVASVPFYVRDVAYGDTITTSVAPSGALQFREVVKRSGYSVYRILLRESLKKTEVINRLLDFGVLLEQDGNLLAFAVSPSTDVDAIVDYLLEGKRSGLWGTQDGYIFEAAAH